MTSFLASRCGKLEIFFRELIFCPGAMGGAGGEVHVQWIG